MPEVETQRLCLRMFTPDDLDALALLYGDPDVVKYIATGKPASREEAEYHLGRLIKYWQEHDFGRWAMTLKPSGRFIGYCGMAMYEGRHELMYALSKQYWGSGYATEAVRATLRYGFEELKLEVIAAATHKQNTASQNVMKKVGMRYEGETRFLGLDYVSYVIGSAEFRIDNSVYILRRA
jgi:RimJ/RimL family protein N-acetyltransferase